jgi:hypothetical protein
MNCTTENNGLNSNNGKQGSSLPNRNASKDHVKTTTTTTTTTITNPPPSQQEYVIVAAKDITTTTATKEQQEASVVNDKFKVSIAEDPTERNMWYGRSDSRTTFPGILRSRGPLKKRLSPIGPSRSDNTTGTVYPPPVTLKESVTSAFFLNGPVMRRASSSSSSFFCHGNASFPPPHLRSETSFAGNLLTEPLLKTPQILGTAVAKENLLSTNDYGKLLSLRTPGLPLATVTSTTTTPFQGSYSSGIQNRKVVTNNVRSTSTFPQKVSSVNFSQQISSHLPYASSLSSSNGKKWNDSRIPGTAGKATSTNQYLRIMHPFSGTPRVMLQKRQNIPEFSPLLTSSKSSLKQSNHASRKQSPSNDAAMDGSLKKRSKTPKMTANPTKIKTKSNEENQDRSAKLTVNKSTSKVQNPFDRSGLFKDVPTTTRPCKCGSSKCLKLYCECFHSAMFCDPNLCRCKDCYNIEEYNSTVEPRGARVLAMLKILSKRPRSFDGDGRKGNSATNGCRCKRSG